MTRKTSTAAPWRRAESDAHGEFEYAALLGIVAVDVITVVKAINKGLPYKALEKCSQRLELTKEDLGVILRIPKRTLARRKQEKRLRPDESDRLLRLSRILAMAIALFEGDNSTAREWLSAPQYALGGATPLEFSSTEVGAREVETLIGRLEYGIPV